MNPSGNSIRTTALALLFLVSFFNYMDRYMLAVLLPAIKADLQLSDTEIGFITGLAFTLFYVTMGIPIARLACIDLRWYVWVPSLAILVSTPMFALTFLTQNPTVVFLSLFLPFMIGVMQGPPSFAVAQGLADVRMRAMAAALLLLITNLIGGGIGPQAVGIMSDYLAAGYHQDSLRYSLLAVSLVFGLWSSLHYFLAGKTIRREFRKPG